jgi:hypothetical protein
MRVVSTASSFASRIGEIEFSRHLKFSALLNLTKGYRDESISGWDLMEVDMAALFSVRLQRYLLRFCHAR